MWNVNLLKVKKGETAAHKVKVPGHTEGPLLLTAAEAYMWVLDMLVSVQHLNQIKSNQTKKKEARLVLFNLNSYFYI